MPATDNAHALLVGIANYQSIAKLPPTILADARDIRDLLVDRQYCGYPVENVQLLLDGRATRTAITDTLAALAHRCDKEATLLIYFSGHGGRIELGEYAGEYLLPVDTQYNSEAMLAQTAVSGVEFTQTLRAIPARKVIVIFDCCHAGGIGQPKEAAAPAIKAGLPERYLAQLASGRGRVILASSRDSELSWILPGTPNSLFTKHLLDGLRGGASGPGGVIRIFDLFDYVQPRVTGDQPDQHPIFKAEIEENFPVALYRGGKVAAFPTTLPVSDDFTYDLFVSYRHQEPDISWVRQTLVPRLEAEGLRVCIDYQCFRLGRPLLLEMARAIEESRYTLAVLSPAYLESNFTELENVLADHLGLEESQYRLLAIIRQDCTPRLGMRANLMLDMTEDKEFDTNLARLVFQLREPPDK